jgi:hypothetical protein
MKKEFVSLLLLSLIFVVTPTAFVLTYAVPYSGIGGSKENASSYGSIASIQQMKEVNSPSWILSGHWATNLINKTKTDFNQTDPAKFDATFTMIMLSGSARHQHQISNFSLTDIKTENDTNTYSGLATITMKKGPATNVPIEIKIINNNVVSIWFDPTKVEKHFGDSPIYGTVYTNKDLESKGSFGATR